VDTEERAQKIYQMMNLFMANDVDRAVPILQELSAASDWHDMYAMCCAIALPGKRAMEVIFPKKPDEKFAVIEMQPGASLKDPFDSFAMRFIVAYANQDLTVCMNLHRAAAKWSPEEYVNAVSALIRNSCTLANKAIDMKLGEQ